MLFNNCCSLLWLCTETPRATLQTFCAGPLFPRFSRAPNFYNVFPALSTRAMSSRTFHKSHILAGLNHVEHFRIFTSHPSNLFFMKLQILHTFQKVPITSWWQNWREIRRKLGILRETYKHVLNLSLQNTKRIEKTGRECFNQGKWYFWQKFHSSWHMFISQDSDRRIIYLLHL